MPKAQAGGEACWLAEPAVMSVTGYRDLDVWPASMSVAEEMHRFCLGLPTEERYGLAAQMRRSAISIPSNIAERSARSNTREFINFLSIAQASRAELETQLILTHRFGYTSAARLTLMLAELERIARMLGARISSLRSKF